MASWIWGAFDWFKNQLMGLGLMNKEATIIFLGLDNAGKTTLLHMLRENKVQNHEPTRHAHNEELQMGSVQFHTYDLGGHLAARRVWKDYFVKVDGIVFLVDAADCNRFEESKQELTSMLSSNELKNVPFLVLGNKIDKKGAVSERELRHYLGLNQTSGKSIKSNNNQDGIRPIELFMCSVIKRTGFVEGFEWLSNQI